MEVVNGWAGVCANTLESPGALPPRLRLGQHMRVTSFSEVFNPRFLRARVPKARAIPSQQLRFFLLFVVAGVRMRG